PWSTAPEMSGARATHHPASATEQQWAETMAAGAASAWRKFQGKYGAKPGWACLSIQMRLPKPWRMINCHPTAQDNENLERFTRLLSLLQQPGWGWNPRMIGLW